MKLTQNACFDCGHRHKIVTQPNGTTKKGKCWLCFCGQHIEPTQKRKLEVEAGKLEKEG